MDTLEKKRDNNDNSNKENAWTIIESYFGNKHLNRLVRHQVESYNHFINVQLQKTIDMFNPVTIHSEQDYDKESKKYSLELIITFTNGLHKRNVFLKNNTVRKTIFFQYTEKFNTFSLFNFKKFNKSS